MNRTPVYIVSACLIGMNTRYDSKNSLNKDIMSLIEKAIIIPLCPEILGGLPTPRKKSTIIGNKVFDEEGKDVTSEFTRGAIEFLNFAKFIKPDRIYLKEYSPSCGVKKTNINWKKTDGHGITTGLLYMENYKIIGVE